MKEQVAKRYKKKKIQELNVFDMDHYHIGFDTGETLDERDW